MFIGRLEEIGLIRKGVDCKMTNKKVKDAVRKKMDVVDYIMAYESGELSPEATKKMFQQMVDTGQVWGLQGSYGRTAKMMLEAGVIHPPKKKTAKNTTDYYGTKIKW